MSQLSIFAPPPCHCGTEPVIRDYHDKPDLVLWCFCDPMVFDTLTEYQDWLSAPSPLTIPQETK